MVVKWCAAAGDGMCGRCCCCRPGELVGDDGDRGADGNGRYSRGRAVDLEVAWVSGAHSAVVQFA